MKTDCIFIVVVVFVTKINLFSSTKIFVFVVVDEKNTATHCTPVYHTIPRPLKLFSR